MRTLTVLLSAGLVLACVQASEAAKKPAGGSVTEKCKALVKSVTKSRDRQATLMTTCLNNGGKL
jgi:hypothetical protein